MPMSSRPPPQDTYARLLSSSRGYPLWTPEPCHELLMQRPEGLAIGDVGVVLEHGSVDVLFNLCLPADHPFHLRHGVPQGFTPINHGRLDIMTITNAEPPSYPIHSSSVTPAKTSGSLNDASERHDALPHRSDLSTSEGAALVLPQGAERYDLLNEELFLEQASQHGAAWYDYAVNRRGRLISPDSLYLITGVHKTLAWSAAVFENASANEHHAVHLRQIEGNNSPPTYRWETTGSCCLEWRVAPDTGPHVEYSIPNQAVFIRGFKIAIRSGLIGSRWVSVEADSPSTRSKNVKLSNNVPSGSSILGRLAGFLDVFSSSGSSSLSTTTRSEGMVDAGEEQLQSDTHRCGYDGTQVKIQRVPDASRQFHPSDALNRYLLEKDPSANIAITHDSHWISLLECNSLTQEELGDVSSVETALSQNYQVVSRDGVVYLERKSPEPAGSRPSSMHKQKVTSVTTTQSSLSHPHLFSDDADPSLAGDNKRTVTHHSHSEFTLNSAGVAGIFGGQEATSGMTTIYPYTGRRWLGWYNSPGSYTVAKRFGRMANSRFWDGLFPSPNDSPAIPFALDGKQGPRYIAALSGTTTQTGHFGYLTMLRSKDMNPISIDGREAIPFCVSYLALKKVDFETPVEPLTLKDGLFAIIPIIVSLAACILSALVYDWFSFSTILLGIISNGLASYVIGKEKLVLRSAKAAEGSPPGHGVLMGEREVVVIKGSEQDVNAITKGRFELETDSQRSDQGTIHSYHTMWYSVPLIVQLLLISQGSLFGQIMFLSSLGVSWACNLYLSSSLDDQTNILFKKLDNPRMLRFRTGTRTTMAVFICLLLFHGVDVSEKEKRSLLTNILRSCLPNHTDIWRRWLDKVVEQLLHLPENEPGWFPYLEEDDGDRMLPEQDRKLLMRLLEDAVLAINGYYASRLELPNDSSHLHVDESQ